MLFSDNTKDRAEKLVTRTHRDELEVIRLVAKEEGVKVATLVRDILKKELVSRVRTMKDGPNKTRLEELLCGLLQ